MKKGDGLFIMLLPMASMLLNRDIFNVRIPFFGYTSLFMVMFFMSMPLFLIRLMKNRKIAVGKRTLQVAFSLICMAGVVLLSIAINSLTGTLINYSTAIESFISYTIFFLVFFFTVKTVSESNLTDEYYRVWLFITLIVNLIGMAQILALQGIPFFESRFIWENMRLGTGRIASTFRWQGMLVAFLGLVLPSITSNIIISKNTVGKLYYIINLMLGIAVLLFTGSRTSLLVLPLSIAPILLSIKNKKAIKAVSVSIMGFFLLGIYLVRLDNNAIMRVFGMHSTGNGIIQKMVYGGARGRQWIWSQAFKYWETAPLFGIGANQLFEYIGMHPHSSYIQVLTEQGLSGFIIFLILIISIIGVCLQLWKNGSNNAINLRGKGLALGLVNFLLYQFSASAVNYHFVYLFIALCVLYCEKYSVSREQHTKE